MKIVEIIGGLGNQMFQAALLLSLRHKFPQESVKADILQYSAYHLHNGYELDRIFSFRPEIASEEEIRKLKFVFPNYLFSRAYRRLPPLFQKKTTCIEAQDMRFDASILQKAGPRYYSGYWQNHAYFDHVSDELRRQFSFPPFTDPRNAGLSEKLLNDPLAVGVHVRRGDYLKDPLFRKICTEKYYSNAFRALPEDFRRRHFYFFSNDPMWCREVLVPMLNGAECCIVDWNTGSSSFRDMQLLSCCRTLILSNSTFSWWSAYLNRHRNAQIFVPEKWINQKLAVSPVLPEWQTVSIYA